MAPAEGSDAELVAGFEEVLDRLVALASRAPQDEERSLPSDDDLLADFGALLDRLVEKAEAEVSDYADLVQKLPARDPLLLQTDLLGALDSEHAEELHTQAIATLLRAPFGPQLLGTLLPPDLSFGPDDVRAEHPIQSGEHDERGRRLDLLVRVGSHIIVIENKIKAEDSEDQLDDYHDWATQRDPAGLLVYLTPDGREPTRAVKSKERWKRIDYGALAIACRRVLRGLEASSTGPTEWSEFLRLYLATVVQHVYRLPKPTPDASLASKKRLIHYLRAAVEE